MKFLPILFLILFLSSCHDKNIYYLRADNVDGLKVSDSVEINGLEVGKVDDLSVEPDGKILITLKLQNDVKIRQGSTFAIQSKDLLGTRFINSAISDTKAYITPGDTMPCTARQPFAKTDSLFNKIGEIMDIVIVPKLKKDTTKNK
jgi:phospholipid/cholesterol/gamma-HCH transport system substrate-binding protein